MSALPSTFPGAEKPPGTGAADDRAASTRKRGLVVLFTAVPLLLLGIGIVGYEWSTSRHHAIGQLETTADLAAALTASAVASRNEAEIAHILKNLTAHDAISSAEVRDRAGNALGAYAPERSADRAGMARNGRENNLTGSALTVMRPVVAEGTTIGTISLRTNGSELRERQRRFASMVATATGLAALAVLVIASRLRRATVSPQTGVSSDGGPAKPNSDAVSVSGFARPEPEKRTDERTRELLREQARFKGVFDAVPIGFTWMVVGDVSTRIVNPAHVAITGVPVTQARELGRYREATHPDDRVKQDALHARLVAGEIDHYEIEKRYIHADGSVRWVALTVRYYRDAATGVLQEIDTAIDITERRRAEQGWADASKLLDAMLENTPDFIYFKDRESRFLRFSNAFLRRFNLTDPNELIGKTDFDLFSREHAERAYADEQEIIRSGQPIISKVEKETYADGSVTWAMSTKMAWRDSGGVVVGTFGISKDVTPLKEAEARAGREGDLLRMLLENVPDKIYWKDLESRFVRLSRSKTEELWETLRARHPAQEEERPAYLRDRSQFDAWLIGKTDSDIVGEQRARASFEEEQQIIRTGIPVVNRIEQISLPNGTAWHLITKMPWRDKDGKVIGTFGTTHDISAIKEAEAKLALTHKQLLESSRHAGMAEVATGVLHNVGNVLNSVNVSATLVADQVRHTKAHNIAKLAVLFEQNRGRLGDFMTKDQRGQMIPEYLGTLAESINSEQKTVAVELDNLRKNIEHIKDIVAMQQAYASTSGVIETVSVPDMIEDALRMNSGSLARHDVMTVRDYKARGVITTDKHKVIQILINLVRNAKYACDESGRTDKQIIVRTVSDEQGVKISVIDNGVGIPPANLTRIFEHGFTTRKHGHGFGLHSGALAAKELGGALSAHSEGPGKGATFTLDLPYKMEPQGQ